MGENDRTRCCPVPPEPGSCCGCGTESPSPQDSPSWQDGALETPVGRVRRVRSEWGGADYLGAVRVRCNLGRMRYMVAPGLYACGNPGPESPVFVSANYKLSFDHLRRALAGVDGWILVLDTKGINVWCAAGKGTFGTSELVQRIALERLGEVVRTRQLIVPQLGATGVSAHAVKRESGWQVVYGPVRAADIPAFLAAGLEADAEMRRVHFHLADRLVVIPVELSIWGRYLLLLMFSLFLASGFHGDGYDRLLLGTVGLRAAGFLLVGFLSGAVVTPVLLPWVPGRSFACKGLLTGLVAVGGMLAMGYGRLGGVLEAIGWLLMVPALSSFMALNFTGTSTFTSLSGVRREMQIAIPAQAIALVAGLAAWGLSRFGLIGKG